MKASSPNKAVTPQSPAKRPTAAKQTISKPKSPLKRPHDSKPKSPPKSKKESPLRFESPQRELRVRMANTINGQFAIIFNDKDSDLIAIPINLYNKSGKVVLGIERSPVDVIWGAKLGQWVKTSATAAGPQCPPGLHVLNTINKLFISQMVSSKTELSQQTAGKVILIRDQMGDIVWAGKERINTRPRYVYGKTRQIDIKLYDPFKREVVFCRQFLRFSSNVVCFYLQRMDVMVQPGRVVGSVRQQCAVCGITFEVKADSKIVFRLRPTNWSRQSFNIFTGNDALVGHIKPSLPEEDMSAARELPIVSVEWTKELDPIGKTLLMSATFLIKLLFYDK